MSESKLPNLIIGLTVDSTGIDAGLNRAKSKISRFGGGSGGGVNSGVNNGTGGWGAGGGNSIGDAVLGAALGAGLSRGGVSVSSHLDRNRSRVISQRINGIKGTSNLGTLLDRGMSDRSIKRAKRISDKFFMAASEMDVGGDLGLLSRQSQERKAALFDRDESRERIEGIMLNNRKRYLKKNRGISRSIEKVRQGIEESFVGRAASALGVSSRLGPLAIAGTAYAIGSKVANYQRDEVARTSDLTRFKGSADYGKYQQMKYDYISKPRIEDQRSMGASAASRGGAGSQTATDKLMGAGAATLGGIGYVAGAAFENFAQLFYQPSDNIKVALDIIDRRKNSI